MATFFKYAERNAESRIDWAEVGADMSEMVRDEGRIRQEKKDALLKQSRDFTEYAVNPPMGDHGGFNTQVTDYAANTQEYALMVENLVKSGQMNLREYTNIRANLKQGTEEAFSIAEEYNAQFKEMQERGEIDPETGFPTSQNYEQYVLGTVQGFGNYANHRLWINPVDGVVNLGKMVMNEETGVMEMSTEIGDSQPVNGLRNRVNSQYNYYNLGNSTDGMVSTLGKIVEATMEGDVKTTEDPREGAEFQKALDNFVGSQTTIPTNVSSVLTNTLGINPNTGVPYGFTDDPAKAAADKNLILSIANPLQPASGLPMPAFGVDLKEVLKDAGLSPAQVNSVIANNEAQMKAAEDAIRIDVLSKLDKIETPRTEFNNEKARIEAGRAYEQTELAVTNLADIFAGETQSKVNSALGFIQGLARKKDPTVSRLYIDPENPDLVLVEHKDAEGNITRTEPYDKGENLEDFVVGISSTLIPGMVDLEKALEASGIRDGVRTKTNFVGAAGDSRVIASPVIPSFGEQIPNRPKGDELTPSEAHDYLFEDTSSAMSKVNAEADFFSIIGVENAEVTFRDENSTIGNRRFDTGIVGGRPGDFQDNSAIEIMVPGAMTMSIIIPDNNKAEFKAVNRLIVEALRSGKVLTPNDFSNLIKDFGSYNNSKMAGILGMTWNNGKGPQPEAVKPVVKTAKSASGGNTRL
tara:strand:+ start:5734 stop:7815 length:2082 start_codon:yes stop_codon:yes gene_type:complete